MIEGEILEIERDADLAMTVEEHIEIDNCSARRRSFGVLRIAAMLAEWARPEQANARYGRNLGVRRTR